MPDATNALPKLLRDQQQGVLKEWIALQLQSLATRRDLITDAEIAKQSEQFLDAFIEAMESGDAARPHGPAWDRLHQLLNGLALSRARAGFSPSETAMFVFSLKQPVFDLMRAALSKPDDVARETWQADSRHWTAWD